MWIMAGAAADIPEHKHKHKLQLNIWRFDSIEVGETNYYYFHVSQQPSFESFFIFYLVLMGMQDSILLFPSRSHT